MSVAAGFAFLNAACAFTRMAIGCARAGDLVAARKYKAKAADHLDFALRRPAPHLPDRRPV